MTPSPPILFALFQYSPLVKMANAPDCLSGDRGFESRRGCQQQTNPKHFFQVGDRFGFCFFFGLPREIRLSLCIYHSERGDNRIRICSAIDIPNEIQKLRQRSRWIVTVEKAVWHGRIQFTGNQQQIHQNIVPTGGNDFLL